MRRAWATSAALALHALLLALPALALGGSEVLAQPALLAWLAGALSLQVVELWATRGHDDAAHERTLDVRLAAVTAVILLGVLLASGAEFALRGGGSAWLSTAGAVILLAGIALRGAAMHALKSDFVSPAAGRVSGRFVRSGVYTRLRHPSELGLLAFALGGCALLGSAAGAALTLLVLAPLVVWRARLEDRALCARFPDYAAYAAAVGGLLPR